MAPLRIGPNEPGLSSMFPPCCSTSSDPVLYEGMNGGLRFYISSVMLLLLSLTLALYFEFFDTILASGSRAYRIGFS